MKNIACILLVRLRCIIIYTFDTQSPYFAWNAVRLILAPYYEEVPL